MDAQTIYDNAMEYADTSNTNISEFLNSTGSDGETPVNEYEYPPIEPPPSHNIDIISADIGDLTLPTFVEQVSPPDPDINDISITEFSGIPGYDIAPLVLDMPLRPDTPAMADLGEAPTMGEIPIPNVPSLPLITIPVMREITLPSALSLETITFDGVMPVDIIGDVDASFTYAEGIYQSDLLDNIKAKLNDLVLNGGTGLGADIEADLWDREKERADLALQEAKDKVSAEWAERGFDLPTGVLTSLLLALDTEYLNQRAQSGREIAIKQAEIAKEETQFALKLGADLENMLMTFFNQVAQRSLEAAKATTEYGIAILNARIAKYAAQMEAYKTNAAVFEIRTKAVLAQIEIYKAQLEGQKLISELNMADLEVYKALVGTSQLYIEMYKTEMEAANIRANVERVKIEVFKAQVEAFIAKVQYNTSLFTLYDSAIKGEMAKAQVYATQVEAYKDRVEASKVESDVIMSEAQTEIAVEKMKLEKFMTMMQAFEIKVKQESARCEVVLGGDKVLIEKYAEDIKQILGELDASIKSYQVSQEAAVGMAGVAAQMDKTRAEFASAATMAAVEAAKAAAQVAAQLVASSLAGITTSTSEAHNVSGSDGSVDQRRIDTANTNWNWNYAR
jgi:hypothetical protein